MTILRRLDDPNSWAEYADSDIFEDGDCPEELLRQAMDPRGISVYSYNGEGELWRCVSALALSRVGLKDVTCAIFSDDDIIRCKLELNTTPGLTFDKIVNKMHRDIKGITLLKVGQFIRMLCKDAEIRVFPRYKIIDFVNGQLKDQNMQRKDVFYEASTIRYGDILLRLWKDEHLFLCQRASE